MESLNLPKGSVRAILAFTVVGLFAFLATWSIVHVSWSTIDAASVVPAVMPAVKEVALLALVFYFMRGKAKEGGVE